MIPSKLSNKCNICRTDIIAAEVTTERYGKICVICFGHVYEFPRKLTMNDKKFLRVMKIAQD